MTDDYTILPHAEAQDMRAAIPGTHVFLSMPNCVPVEVETHATWDGAVQHYIARGYTLVSSTPNARGSWMMRHPQDVVVIIWRSALLA
jgi:hypothetical protein